MKILYINNLYYPHVVGGAEIVLRRLVGGMSDRGHDGVVLATSPVPVEYEEAIDGIRVLRVALKNTYWPYGPGRAPAWKRAIWHLRDIHNAAMARVAEEVVRRERPDIVCCNNLAGWSVAVWGAIKRTGTPLIQVLHDLYLLCPNSTMFYNGSACTHQCVHCKIFRLRHANKSKQVDAVVGVSRFILERLVEHKYFNNARIRLAIHSACDPAVQPLRRSMGSGDRVQFGFIGTLAPAKGIELLLETFLRVDLSNAELRIAGAGLPNYEAYLRKRYACDRIHFLGYSQPKDFFPTIDVLIVPSMLNEALGMVVPEAFAYDVPVIASRRGGIPEMVKDGVNGFLFEPKQPQALAALLRLIAENPQQIDNLRQNVVVSSKPFLDVKGWLDKYEKLFRMMIER